MLSPKDSPLGKQLSQYVCVRITRMDNVDIGLFDHDWNNAVYFFILNADEQIYMRYGGRDSQSRRHLSEPGQSGTGARSRGWNCTGNTRRASLKKTERPKPLFPREIPLLVERTFAPKPVRGVPSDRRFPEHSAGAGWHARQADEPLPLARHQDDRAFIWMCPRAGGEGGAGAAQAAGMKPGDRIAS